MRWLEARAVAVAVGVAIATAIGSCGGAEGSTEELCEIVRTDRTISTVFAGFDPTDTERSLEQLRAARVTLGELRAAAPDEVRDDLDVEIDYVQALVDGLEGVEGGDAGMAVEVVRGVTAEHPGVADAAAALAAYSAKRCEP